MEITIMPGALSGSIRAIESKSHAHRLLIVAALSHGDSVIRCLETSQDIDATVRCLNGLGAVILRTQEGFHVRPISKSATSATIDCGESGSTLRFLLPIIGAYGKTVNIQLHGRLPERPLSPLWEELAAHGMRLSKPKEDLLHCEGQLKPGTYKIPGDISSQFISGLLFALPLLNGESKIVIQNSLESKSYVDMTRDALTSFEIETVFENNVFHIPGEQIPKAKNLIVEGDWSNCAFWITSGALSDRGVTCTNLNRHSIQGDLAVAELIRQFGGIVTNGKDRIISRKAPLHGLVIDASNIPDLVPILAVCATMAQGTTQITHAQRLKIKESDRIQTVSTMLRKLGASVKETDDGLIIEGGRSLKGGVRVSSYNDHRIAMAAAIAATQCVYPVTITEAEAVNKSYPRFWDDFAALGGILSREES